MKARVSYSKTASPFLTAANVERSPDAGFVLEYQELCSRQMDLALGIHKASLDSAVSLHSCAVEICDAIDINKNQASQFVSIFGACIEAAAKSFAICMELHRSCLTLLAPYAMSYDRPFATSFGSQAEPATDELAIHMDVAIGGHSFAADESIVSSADSKGRLLAIEAAQEEETEMDEFAVGSRAA
jgi:hypothetical protein